MPQLCEGWRGGKRERLSRERSIPPPGLRHVLRRCDAHGPLEVSVEVSVDPVRKRLNYYSKEHVARKFVHFMGFNGQDAVIGRHIHPLSRRAP